MESLRATSGAVLRHVGWEVVVAADRSVDG
jgi:hypothetical protein